MWREVSAGVDKSKYITTCRSPAKFAERTVARADVRTRPGRKEVTPDLFGAGGGGNVRCLRSAETSGGERGPLSVAHLFSSIVFLPLQSGRICYRLSPLSLLICTCSAITGRSTAAFTKCSVAFRTSSFRTQTSIVIFTVSLCIVLPFLRFL